ncbi:hypothetical protein FA15DRAFT_664573 [Coprinopsis marcescibilis]|uniref:Uncharacterized protein n=1 Tax=Coprinopsis marcescibilis TaxID=230819 RepID=A0A5C3L8B5_COPMA|nr:hypothetical protein FA15DRAFT_664573 [Coprinopsis marcescibilis]
MAETTDTLMDTSWTTLSQTRNTEQELSEIAQIDARTKALRDELLKLQKHRNSIVTFSGRFPNEVLSRIFFECLAFEEKAKRPPVKKIWLQLTQVCHQWREVALGYPRLWLEISFASPFWTMTCLKRSKLSPITINLCDSRYPAHRGSPNPTKERAVKEALKQISRIKSLEISTYPSLCASRLTTLSQSTNGQKVEAPILETLKLDRHNSIFHLQQQVRITLDERFLNGGTPNLRRLELTNIGLTWTGMHIFENLTFFYYDNREELPPAPALPFIQALASMSKLTHLHLAMTCPEFGTIGLEGAIARFPALEYLSLEHGNANDYAELLHHFALPASATVELHISTQLRQSTAAGLRHLSTTLSSSWLSAPLARQTGLRSSRREAEQDGEAPIKIQSLRILGNKHSSQPGLLVEGWSQLFEHMEDGAKEPDGSGRNIPAALRLEAAGHWAEVEEDVVPIPNAGTFVNPNANIINHNDVNPIQSVPMADVKMLWLQGDLENVDMNRHVATLRSLKSVACVDEWSAVKFLLSVRQDPVFRSARRRQEEIEVGDEGDEGQAAEDAVQAVAEAVTANQADVAQPADNVAQGQGLGAVRPNVITYYKVLEHIMFMYTKFDEEVMLPQISEGVDLKRFLLHVVRRRNRRGGKIRKISFFGCSGLDEQDMEKLRSGVEEVVWEERASYSRDNEDDYHDHEYEADHWEM